MRLFSDQESEHRVISGMLHSEAACITSLNELVDNDFSDPFARSVFQLTYYLYRQAIRPTPAEIFKEGLKYGLLEGRKDLDRLQEIVESFIDDENIGYWIGKVQEASKGRRAQKLLVKFSEAMEEERKDINSLVTEMGSEFFNLSLESRASNIDTGKDIAEFACDLIDRKVLKYRETAEACRMLGTVPLDGTPTGLPDLDRLTLGYKPGDLIIMAAQTGHGKTAFALNTANAVCVQRNSDTMLYTNTEMSREQIAFRWGSILSGVPHHLIRSGALTNEQANQVKEAYRTQLAESGFLVAHEPNLTPKRLEIVTKKMVLQHKIKLMILDYVGRLDTSGSEKEWLALYQIIKSQKIMAQNLNIACMCLVQLNPDGTLQGAKRMKNEADMMMKFVLVDNDDEIAKIEKYRKRKFEQFNAYIELEKSRDSASGIKIPIVFDKERQRMRQAEVVPGYSPPTDWTDFGKEVKR